MAARILILDDEEFVLNVMKRALSGAGYEITTVSTGPEFENALSGEGETPFELIIMDLHLVGSKTEDLISAARGKNPARKFLFVSGTARPPEGQAGNFIQKPFMINDLRKAVKERVG
jgi:DNA-binding NtrC family response regulator